AARRPAQAGALQEPLRRPDAGRGESPPWPRQSGNSLDDWQRPAQQRKRSAPHTLRNLAGPSGHTPDAANRPARYAPDTLAHAADDSADASEERVGVVRVQ